ncbi:MAG: proton-conducting transporter transmembrane domain-containing protein [Candidatus Nanopelagicales bacterium]
MIDTSLLVQFLLMLLAISVAIVAPARYRALLTGPVVSAIGIAGVVTGWAAVTGQHGSLPVPITIPLGAVTFAPSALGGYFMLVIGAVGAICGIYAIGYVHGPAASRTSWIALAVFVTAMEFVPAAADVVAFLLAWELMAVTSAILVVTEHAQRPAVKTAALWYVAMTQLSFFLVLIGLGILSAGAGSTQFAVFRATHWDAATANLAFVLLVLGFGAKSGIVPLHVWLPRAHPEAPSHVSALMSAAMVKLGIYGAILTSTQFLRADTMWWGVLLLALGTVSAVYGILQASVTSDLKRLLAFSTTENVGLMFLALGAASMLRANGINAVADSAIAACLFLVIAHAAFKTTLFLGAGSILRASGQRDLDLLGGLGSRMPVTSIAFGLAALGAAALPLTAGFVSEWVLLQSLIHGAGATNRILAITMPIAVGAVALTAGLALMTFVKAYGIAFLARPRSEGTSRAKESPISMRIAMLLGAAIVIAMGLTPGLTAHAIALAAGISGVKATGPLTIDLSGVAATLNPGQLLALALVLVLPVVATAAVVARKRPRRAVDLAWGCGGNRLSPRMQYTATSYAEPLSRIFDDSLRPERDVIVTHSTEARYLVDRIQYRQRLSDVFDSRLYTPIISFVERIGASARRLQNGKIHFYLAYSFVAFLVVLVVMSL